ncbi:hypothetical protein GA0115255_1240512 [Streptomyces sp. Ncost-T6T-2b]|nr:hypothetical protein GA0115255_1240512 [Streptomyces sp. Ncost-T6T-2b]
MAARTLDLTSERLRATLEAIRRPGGGLDAAITPDTTGLGVGYRWSSLARVPDEAPRHDETPRHDEAPRHDETLRPDETPRPGDGLPGSPQPGDRAPDAPCVDAVTGVRTRLHRVFAGPRTTVLGFGPGSATVLREVAAAYGDAGVRTCRVYAPYESGARYGPGTAVVDDEGHAAAAYGTGAFGDTGTGTGTDTGTVIVVRPDHHLGLSAPADDARSVHAYLRRLHGAGRPRNGSPALVDAARKG